MVTAWAAPGRRYSRMIVRITRMPSLTALRLLTPCSRLCSTLATSLIRSRCRAARTLISVSISKPSPHSFSPSAVAGRVTSGRSRRSRTDRQNALYP